MKERGLIFAGEMVRAILEGRKSQTRRIFKQATGPSLSIDMPEPGVAELSWLYGDGPGFEVHEEIKRVRCPYGVPGDRIWVKETWADTNGESGPMLSYKSGGDRFLTDESYPVDYSLYPNCIFTMWCSDLRRGEPDHSWRSPATMPRWASRITLEVTDVRVQRLQDISEEDAKAEGATWGYCDAVDASQSSYRSGFACLWESINGAESWQQNPWVWAITFKDISAEVNK